ncbi:MAG: hypothetical protein P4L64_08480 [Caulobacteraceae bacterium]|nr:hypothetical protein [Caulobacteraceae bacterium]
MTADECHERAETCASNAALAPSESVRLEFMRLAAQWRALASRTIFLGHIGEPMNAPNAMSVLGALNAIEITAD